MTTYKRDFFSEAHALLKQEGYKNYIIKLLPAGKWKGNEYVVKNPTRNDNKTGSFTINAVSGKWADFATDKAGNDLIGLTAYILGINPVEACHHIGVPKLDTNHSKMDFKAHRESNTDKLSKYTDKKELELTEAITEQLEQVLSSENTQTKPAEKNRNLSEPPTITESDVDYHSTRTFKCKPSYFYQYKNSLGITIGYIVRWEFERNGKIEKGTRPYIYDWDKQKWVSKFFGSIPPKTRPLYNLPEILENKAATILIVEGEKTAEAAKLLFPEYVVTTSSGGANQASKSEWQYLKGRNIIISPDAGEAGSDYARKVLDILKKQGVKNISQLLPNKLGNYVVTDGKPTKRIGNIPYGYDLADSLADGWNAELIKQVQSSQDFTPFFQEVSSQKIISEELKENEKLYEFEHNKTYKLTPEGLYLRYFIQASEKDSIENGYDALDSIVTLKEAWRPLCGYIKPLYKIWDENNSWGALVSFKDINGRVQEIFLKRTDWLGDKGAIEILQDQGLFIKSLEKKTFEAINTFLQFFQPDKEAIGVEKVGWQGDNEAYMLPFINEPRNCYIAKKGDTQTEYILQQKTSTPRVLYKKGSLEQWKRTVGEVCRGNHLHTFAILAALAAPILKLLNEEGGFFHYVGTSSIGKSTILHVAKSVSGYKNLGSFRITDNALESVCKNSNDGSVFLDEIGESDPDSFFKMVYMLANGVTKGRANRNGDAKETVFFTVLAQSTGEIGLEAKLAEKKIQAKGGQLIRMAELDADRAKGLNTFDLLKINPDTGKQFETGAEQADYLKSHATENCGVVIDEFMKDLVKDLDVYIRGIRNLKEEWTKKLPVEKGQAEIDRMIKRFSTVYSVGVTASVIGIIPHTKNDIEQSLNAMFDNWITRRGGNESYEFKAIVNNLYKLCIENQYSRFQNAYPKIDEKVNFVKDSVGYYKMEGDELKEFWIRPRAFDEYVLKGRDKKVFLPMLVKNGYLIKNNRGENTNMKRSKNEPAQCFYIILVDVLLNIKTSLTQ